MDWGGCLVGASSQAGTLSEQKIVVILNYLEVAQKQKTRRKSPGNNEAKMPRKKQFRIADKETYNQMAVESNNYINSVPYL